MSRPAIGCGTDGEIAMSSGAHGPEGSTTGVGSAVGCWLLPGLPEACAGVVGPVTGLVVGAVVGAVAEGLAVGVVEEVVEEEEVSATCAARSRPGRPVAGPAEQPSDAHDEQGGDAEHHQPTDPVHAGGEPSARHSGHVGHANQRSRSFRPGSRGRHDRSERRSELARKPALRSPGVRAPRAAPAVVRRARARPALAPYDGICLGRSWSRSSMLQQTPVARVLPVLRARGWSGGRPRLAWQPHRLGRRSAPWGRLGYPRRATRLHAAATVITEQHHGTVPDTYDTLRSLPGVGDYTAAADRWPSPSVAGNRCSTPTCAGCWRAW